MIEYGDRMLDKRERQEAFYMGDNPDFQGNALYYATGAELKEAVNTAFGREMKRLEEAVMTMDRQLSIWMSLAVFFGIISLALCVVVSWLS